MVNLSDETEFNEYNEGLDESLAARNESHVDWDDDIDDREIAFSSQIQITKILPSRKDAEAFTEEMKAKYEDHEFFDDDDNYFDYPDGRCEVVLEFGLIQHTEDKANSVN